MIATTSSHTRMRRLGNGARIYGLSAAATGCGAIRPLPVHIR